MPETLGGAIEQDSVDKVASNQTKTEVEHSPSVTMLRIQLGYFDF